MKSGESDSPSGIHRETRCVLCPLHHHVNAQQEGWYVWDGRYISVIECLLGRNKAPLKSSNLQERKKITAPNMLSHEANTGHPAA